MSVIQIHPLSRPSRAKIGSAVDVLAQAFYDDPLYSYLLPDERRRQRNIAAIMRLLMRVSVPDGHVYTVEQSGTVTGAISLLPPGGYPFSMIRMAVASAAMTATPSLWGRSMLTLARRGRPYMDAVERLHFDGPHWYLAVVGVDSRHQGRGIGARLLQKAAELADTSAHPLYLETNNARNIALYRRFGFDLISETRMPGDGPPVWTMLREHVR